MEALKNQGRGSNFSSQSESFLGVEACSQARKDLFQECQSRQCSRKQKNMTYNKIALINGRHQGMLRSSCGNYMLDAGYTFILSHFDMFIFIFHLCTVHWDAKNLPSSQTVHIKMGIWQRASHKITFIHAIKRILVAHLLSKFQGIWCCNTYETDPINKITLSCLHINQLQHWGTFIHISEQVQAISSCHVHKHWAVS